MNATKTLLSALTLVLGLLPSTLFAQLRMDGRIVAANTSLPYAEVLLLDTLGQFVQGAFTDENGYFELTASAGDYLLTANFLGYTSYQQQVKINTDRSFGDILLIPAGKDLAAITVRAQRKLVEQQADRLIFHVENSVAAAGGSGLSALELTPGVRLQNGIIELIGRGNPAVLLNGRLLQLTGDDLMNYLSALAADDIASIEVIANPPAKYAAAGQGGLLNIKLKTGRGNSWKNNFSTAHTQAFYGHTNATNSFSLQQNKTRLSASASIARGFQRDFEGIDIFFPSGRWNARMINKSKRNNHSGRIAIDQEITPSLSLGGQYLGNFANQGFNGPATTSITDLSGRLDSTLVNQQASRRPVASHTANVHGLWKLDTSGRSISFDLDLFDYNNELTQTSIVETFLPDGSLVGLNLANDNLADQRINNHSARVDITHPLTTFELSYGLSLVNTRTTADQQNFDTRSGSPIFNPTLSNQFEYSENVQAAYLNAKGQLGEKWDWQLGLRAENTATKSFSRTLDQTNTNSYLRFFPTLFLAYHAKEDHDYSFSYGRRINRPGFRDLNPFRVYVNSNNYSEGNPFLQPSFTDRLEFNHSFRGKLHTNLFFNRTLDGHGTLFAAEEEGAVQAVVRQNYYTDYFFGIGERYTLEKGSWWISQNQLYLYAGLTDILPGFDTQARNGAVLNLSSNNTFVLGTGTKLQVNAFYTSAHRSNVFTISATYGLTLGLRQQIGKQLKLGLLCNDIFDTASLRSLVSEVDGIKTDYGSNYANRYVRFTASFSFGNKDIKGNDRAFGNEGVRRRSN